jgi:hypothetical protein
LPVHKAFGILDPPVLECKKALIIMVSPSEIKFSYSLRFDTLDSSPEKPGRCPIVVELRVGAAIFVLQNIAELQGQHSRDWQVGFVGHSNL